MDCKYRTTGYYGIEYCSNPEREHCSPDAGLPQCIHCKDYPIAGTNMQDRLWRSWINNEKEDMDQY